MKHIEFFITRCVYLVKPFIYCLLCLFCLFPALVNALALPDRQHTITPYQAVTTTKVAGNAENSLPIAVSSAATENGNLHLQVRTGTLDAPMDAYFGIVAQPITPNTIMLVLANGSLQPYSGTLHAWKNNVTSIDESIFDGFALSALPAGKYTLYLLLVPAGSVNQLQGNYYLWESNLQLSSNKDLPVLESVLSVDQSTVLTGDVISINHPSIEQHVPINVTFNDGSGFSVTTTAIPTTHGQLKVNTPPLIIDQAPYIRSGTVDVLLEGVIETASIYIVAPPELENSIAGDISLMVLQFSADKLRLTLDKIANMSSEKQAAMATTVASIEAQQAILLQQISQINTQQVSVDIDDNISNLSNSELQLVDRLMLMHLLTIAEPYLAEQIPTARTINPRNSAQENLDDINRRIAAIRENANSLADNTLNAIKNVGIPGTQVLVNGITVGLGIVAITTTSTPLAIAAGGTAAFAVLIQTTGLFTTTLVLEPSIDAVNGRVADLGKASKDALIVLGDGFVSIGLSALGSIKWAGATFASYAGLAKDTLAGFFASTELACNTQQANMQARAVNTEFCALIDIPLSGIIAGVWSTSYGEMTFPAKSSGSIRAPYSSDEGRILGSINALELMGHWVEKGSARKCDSQLDGSFYWGKVVFSFNAQATEFNGVWGYCDDVPSRTWVGSKNE